MSSSISSLSESNHEQLTKYLKFFRMKRDGSIRSLKSEFSNAIDDRLHDDMFSKEDVVEFANFLKTSVMNLVNSDLSNMVNMGTLVVSQLLDNAQSAGVDLQLDTSRVENAMLLDAIERMSIDGMRTAKQPVGKLTSLKDEAKAMRDESERLENTNKQLQDRYNQVHERASQSQHEVARLMKEKRSMMEDLMKLQDKINNLNNNSASDSKNNDELSDRMRRMEEALDVAQEENNKRVSETTQYQQMKKLMQQQSNTIKDLRRRLQKYEPDDAKEEGL